MTEEEINKKISDQIEKSYKWLHKEIKTKIAKDQMKEFGTELLHFVILELYNKSPEYKQKLLKDEKVPYWILTSSGLQLRSGSSPFYNQIRKTRMSTRSGDVSLDNEVYEPYDPEMYDCFVKGMENLNFYYRKLLEEKYINELSFNAISQKYKITLKHVRRDVYIGILQIRKFCNHI